MKPPLPPNEALSNPSYPTDLTNAEFTPAASIPESTALPIKSDPVSKLPSPSITNADPDIGTSFITVTVSATLLFISKYSIKKSNLSGLVDFGIGTFKLNSSGENPVSIAGFKDKSLINHSPDSARNCKIVSVFIVLSKLNFGLKVCSTVSKFWIPSISSFNCSTTGSLVASSVSSNPKFEWSTSCEVFKFEPDKWKYNLPFLITLPLLETTLFVSLPFIFADIEYVTFFLRVNAFRGFVSTTTLSFNPYVEPLIIKESINWLPVWVADTLVPLVLPSIENLFQYVFIWLWSIK